MSTESSFFVVHLQKLAHASKRTYLARVGYTYIYTHETRGSACIRNKECEKRIVKTTSGAECAEDGA